MSLTKIKQSSKAVAAVVGSVVTALIAFYGPETPAGAVLALIGVLAAGVITWAAPKNTPTSDQGNSAVEGTFYTPKH